MSEQVTCGLPCSEHGTICTKIQQLEKTVDELKAKLSSYMPKEEAEKQLGYIEEEIKELKEDSERHYKDNVNLQQMLTRLDEFTKSLKESLAMNQKATEQLMEKIDKMYDLMLNFKHETTSNENAAPKNEIKIINDSNNKSESTSAKEKESPLQKLGDIVKDYGTVILILAAIVAYLATGHWPLSSTGITH